MQHEPAPGMPEAGKLCRELITGILFGVEEAETTALAYQLCEFLIDEGLGIDGKTPARRRQDAGRTLARESFTTPPFQTQS